MSEQHTHGIADTVMAQQQAVLDHLKQHGREQDKRALAHTTASDVIIEINANQGASKSTFSVKVKDQHYMLAVYTPDVATEKRASISSQRAFQDHLRSRGIPTPHGIGPVFRLGGLAYDCELIEFRHGYQVKPWRNLGETELRSVAKTLATMHNHAQSFKVPDMQPTFIQRTCGLPHGILHNDVNAGNIIFDSTTHEVAGVIDFERMRYGIMVSEVAKTAGDFLDIEQKSDHSFTVHLTPKVKQFLDTYQETRPLNSAEARGFEWRMLRSAWRKCLTVNFENGAPIRKFQLRGEILKAINEFRPELHAEMTKLLGTQEQRDMKDIEKDVDSGQRR